MGVKRTKSARKRTSATPRDALLPRKRMGSVMLAAWTGSVVRAPGSLEKRVIRERNISLVAEFSKRVAGGGPKNLNA